MDLFIHLSLSIQDSKSSDGSSWARAAWAPPPRESRSVSSSWTTPPRTGQTLDSGK